MTDQDFDRALVRAAFALAAERGWSRVSVAEAARRAELPLDQARARFPVRGVILLRFGSLADQQALAGTAPEGSPRDRLFDIIMRRIDALHDNRDGVLALLRHLPCNPGAAALLAAANLRSMGWMLEGAGIDATGLHGRLRKRGLLAVWLATVRAWQSDTSDDLAATMATLDRGLRRAERVEQWLSCRRTPTETPAAEEPAAAAPDAAAGAAGEASGDGAAQPA